MSNITPPTLPNPNLYEFYEGLDPSLFSFLTGSNLNAAPKQLKANQDAIVAWVTARLNAIVVQTDHVEVFTAVKDQTVFTTSVSYIPGKSMIFLNGRKLLAGIEVTDNTGTDFTIVGVPLELGDKIEFVGYAA